jgi:hypothetical protein
MDIDNINNNQKDIDYILIQKLKKNSESIINLKELEKLSEEELKKRLSLDNIDQLTPEMKNFHKKEFYKKFVNGIKKAKENKDKDATKNNNEGQFMNMVNKMMDKILIKNNNLRNTINGNQNKEFTFNKQKTFDNDLKSIILIQRKFKEYKNKKISFEQMIKEKQNYLSFQQIKNKTKDELEIELIKNINKNKELSDIINYLKNKIEILDKKNKNLEKINTKEKTELGIEKQEDINIIKKGLVINPNFNKNNSKEINDNNSILKKDKRNQSTKGKKRVTICDNNDQADIIKKVNNINNDSSKKSNNEGKVLKTEIIENPKEKTERMKKSRGLRKLLTKRGKEKKDTLRKYFRKFYLAGIFMSIRQGLKQKTLDIKDRKTKRTKSVDQGRPVTTVNRGAKYSLNDNDEDNEENEQINKIKMKKKLLLSKIVYRKDRVQTVILKKNFQKLNLRAKLISLQEAQKERLAKTKTKSKLRKKKIFKSKSVDAFEGDKYNKTVISKKNNNDNNIGLIGKY